MVEAPSFHGVHNCLLIVAERLRTVHVIRSTRTHGILHVCRHPPADSRRHSGYLTDQPSAHSGAAPKLTTTTADADHQRRPSPTPPERAERTQTDASRRAGEPEDDIAKQGLESQFHLGSTASLSDDSTNARPNDDSDGSLPVQNDRRNSRRGSMSVSSVVSLTTLQVHCIKDS